MFLLWDKKIADIGCGAGGWLLELEQWGAAPENLFGIDLDVERVELGRRRCPKADLRVGDASRLPWPDGSFDLIIQFTLFTSILDPAMKKDIASEMMRVLKPAGAILWYDFRSDNPRNPHVRGIGAAEIRSLFAGHAAKLQQVTLAPPVARLIVPISFILASLLEKLPLLRTHYLAVIRKQAG